MRVFVRLHRYLHVRARIAESAFIEGYFVDTGWVQQDEGSYRPVRQLLEVAMYSFDDGGVYVSNPGRGAFDYDVWSDFPTM